MMKIIMGCDHGGFELKETLKKVLIEKGYEVRTMESINRSVSIIRTMPKRWEKPLPAAKGIKASSSAARESA